MTTTTTDLRYYHGRKSPIGMDAPSAKAFRWIFDKLTAGAELVAGTHRVILRHEDACARCARPLTVPASIDTGFGPDCAAKLGIDWRELDGVETLPMPLEFITAGRAVFTASSTKGGRFTFKVRRARARKDDTTPRWFVSVLTGEDNAEDFTYLGTIVGARS